MNVFYAGITLLLFVTLMGVLVLWGHAPTAADRLLAASLSGALGMALLLLVAEAWSLAVLEDVAVVVAVLGAVAVSTSALRSQAAQRARTR